MPSSSPDPAAATQRALVALSNGDAMQARDTLESVIAVSRADVLRLLAMAQPKIFDDTIEHEAWNRSDADRYSLIFDIWRPELSEDERACVAALCEAIDAYGDNTPWDA
jgi:hypothetical protein